MSSISAGTATGTALVSTGDTTGALQLQVNGTTPSITLAANGSIGVGSTPGYGTNGQVLTSAGTGSAPTWTTPASATAATQAQMEAASSNTVFATPLSLKWNPGVAKMWLKCDAAGTINASLNVTSISDDGTGRVTVTLTTSFSSADYSVVGSASTAELGQARFVTIFSPAAGSFTGNCFSTSGQVDPVNYFFAAFGDQS
jgi:hypothetical protein